MHAFTHAQCTEILPRLENNSGTVRIRITQGVSCIGGKVGNMKQVTNADLKEFLAKVGQPVTVADIITAMDYNYDSIQEICARLVGMTKRPLQNIGRCSLNGRWAYFVKR